MTAECLKCNTAHQEPMGLQLKPSAEMEMLQLKTTVPVLKHYKTLKEWLNKQDSISCKEFNEKIHTNHISPIDIKLKLTAH